LRFQRTDIDQKKGVIAFQHKVYEYIDYRINIDSALGRWQLVGLNIDEIYTIYLSPGRLGRALSLRAAKWEELMAKIVICGVALAAALALASCGIGSTLGPASLEDQQSRAEAATTTPRLQAGEKIRITVFNEPSLGGEYEIDQSGFISLQLAGTVKVAGFTQPELEQELAKKFRSEYLRNPKVTVSLLSLRPFYIVGEVEKPGEYAYKSGLNVMTALALAGGATYRGSRSAVYIQRVGESGMREYPISSSVMILPGDLIRVPERYF
jgi:hypothetical protein